ncbi:uncharacterized protein [Atheta coriaria]|uniref:uncharacterized protein n=1 Tax=Dalotia coriaria TaxID=877792 RepID=UPI0031F39ABD
MAVTTTTMTTATTTTKLNPKDVSTQTKTSKKLSRSASIERIKKLNTYICSQNYFFLPALITWLRAPHDKLQASLERFIAILKFMLFSTFLPRLAIKLCISAALMSYRSLHNFQSRIIPTFEEILKSTKFIQFAVYFALTAVVLQLVTCLYYLSGVMQSGGFVFLCSCLYLITQMNYSCLQFFLREKETFSMVGGRMVQVQKRLSRKDILGKRTISNMNLI